ncbi:hypothetical protein LTR09_002254 [Extremus antarcticus]|uniref:Cleavage/polyadenylation specificity factor A subunit N-terminal domain-containing protein n=1 Tax=Extremus antarcticus TaxID=702011 RepID=A0AAJ0GGR7_9PEZI|nr:hypothetical protein LTR09_002254 [Extremus antarcticus]
MLTQPSQTSQSGEMTGLLTRTVAQSPVVRWILHARIRLRYYNDVVFVGDDYIQVKQAKEIEGHLEHVATKTNFDTRIRAARTFSNIPASDDDDFSIKQDDEESKESEIPPQCIVLTTDSNELLFIHLASDDNRSWRFVQQACPIPTFDRLLFQPGEHLAVDPYSRALAVAANEREVVIYSAKPKERIQHELQTGDKNWCPISAQRPLQVDGVIQHIDFLYPPLDDNGAHNEDQILLLLIVADQRRTRALWIEWYYESDLHSATVHRGQLLDTSSCVPNLLVPLRNAAFLLTKGGEITHWKDILCGAAVPSVVHYTACEAAYPGSSPKKPMWANWCRPVRGSEARDDIDYLYLIREDGRVYLFHVTTSSSIESSHAGDFYCHVGTGFASLGPPGGPDILAAAGDMSGGQIQSIGAWFSPVKRAQMSRPETMEMELIETIPNWASVTDMAVTTLPGKSMRSRDGIFVTSCRQPYGAITELRRGLEARVAILFEEAGSRSVSEMWAIPLTPKGHVILVLSSPMGTRFLEISADADMEEITEIDAADIALDSSDRTLATAFTLDAKIVQVTEHSVRISPGTTANFEDCARLDCEPGSANLAAGIATSPPVVLVAMRSGVDSGFKLVCYTLVTDDLDVSGHDQIKKTGQCDLTSEPLAVATIRTTAYVTTADGKLCTFTIGDDGSCVELSWRSIPTSSDGASICDSIIVLEPAVQETSISTKAMVVCGLRDGRIYSLTTELDRNEYTGIERMISFGQSKVELAQSAYDRSNAYAISGLDTCLLTWVGEGSSALHIQNIWLSDKLRPELAQGPVKACTHIPPAHLLSSPGSAASLADSLLVLSGNEFFAATIEHRTATVPRQIPVSGTPSRLIYAEQQRCLVCVSTKYETRAVPSSLPHAKPEERRQIFPVIDFVPARNDAPSYTYEMQPGDRVYALLEWSFKQSEDKTYSFILAGGSYTRPSGSVRGRITFLQPTNKNWEIKDVKEGRSIAFKDSVYALALMDDLTFVACTGKSVVTFGFAEEQKKWEPLCKPLDLASVGVFVTVASSTIYVSTNDDSLVSLEMVRAPDGDEYPFTLQLKSSGPRAEQLLSHLVLPSSNKTDETSESKPATTLMTTKHGHIVALSHPTNTGSNASTILLEAQLPRSLTRLRQCSIRPRWKAVPPQGVLVDNIVGCAPDGTLVGVAILDEGLWRKLSWLQRLCEWSEELSPHSWQTSEYSVSEGSYARNERIMPVGLVDNSDGSGRREDVVMRTGKPKAQDGHIDGDVLARLMVDSSAAAKLRLKTMINEAAQRDDRAGEWVRRHLDSEVEAVGGVVDALQQMLECWI